MYAKLQFTDYHVINVEYKFDPHFSNEEEKLVPNFGYHVNVNKEDLLEASVILNFTVGDRSLKQSSMFVAVSIVGNFSITDPEDEDDKESIMEFYKVNSLAILYPYLRGIVSDITSKGSESPLILPTLNIVALVHSQEGKEETIDNE